MLMLSILVLEQVGAQTSEEMQTAIHQDEGIWLCTSKWCPEMRTSILAFLCLLKVLFVFHTLHDTEYYLLLWDNIWWRCSLILVFSHVEILSDMVQRAKIIYMYKIVIICWRLHINIPNHVARELIWKREMFAIIWSGPRIRLKQINQMRKWISFLAVALGIQIVFYYEKF